MDAIRPYLAPAAVGTLIVFAIRLVFGGLEVALIGIFTFTVVLLAVAGLSRMMKWQDAPMVYAAIAAIAVTVSFLARHAT